MSCSKQETEAKLETACLEEEEKRRNFEKEGKKRGERLW